MIIKVNISDVSIFATSNNKQQHKGTKNSSEVQKY